MPRRRRARTLYPVTLHRPLLLLLALLILLSVQVQATLLPGERVSGERPTPTAPTATFSLPPPLLVVGSTPLWVPEASDLGASNTVLPTEDAFRELYAGRADLVLGTLPPPPPPAGTSRPLSVPVGVSAISVAYNLPGVNLRLDTVTLCALLSGKISAWNAPAVAALNRGAALPALPVLLSARTARNGTSLAVAGACVKAGIWPPDQYKSNWSGGAAFRRATLGAQRTDLNIPGALALFSLQATPPGVQLAKLRSGGNSFVAPRSELGLSGPRLPGARPILPSSFGPLHASSVVGAYPLRGLVWASVMPEQAYRGRGPERAQALLALISALRSGSGRGVSGLPQGTWTTPALNYGGVRVSEEP